MIFPKSCKIVGNASTKPYGDRVYFITEYLVRRTENGAEVLKVNKKEGTGLLREVESVELIASEDETAVYRGSINTYDRAGLIEIALGTKKRCTVFGEDDEHMTFVCDPDLSSMDTIHVFDTVPPKPTLSYAIKDLERIGFFEKDNIMFSHHIGDISNINANVYPCRAGGFAKTLDRDLPSFGEEIACCKTGRLLCAEEFGKDGDFVFRNTCPTSFVSAEPFISRCCRVEDTGIKTINGFFGVVVHWASSPRIIAAAIDEMIALWREKKDGR